ncbi:MAG: hypothetical protein OXI37_07840 [Gammaproteobacteria bacterium]|nr:hypothetical protein [Gammaproteobacteria bacterium]
MSESNKLNGSVGLLAKAMKQVFTEAVEGTVEPIHEELKGIKSDIKGVKVTSKLPMKACSHNLRTR